jgi:lipoate-protein ligase B
MVAAPLAVRVAGEVPYDQALRWQERLWAKRRRDQIGDTVLVLQHPPVVTLGQSGGSGDLRVSLAELRRRGVGLYQTNRGGRAAYHGPGQLVAYPILRLPDRDLHAYLWRLEEVLVRLLAEWGITGERIDRHPGVWVRRDKIAAVGVAVRDDVTTHGLALNVNTDLAYFGLIVPCGLRDFGVTSMQAELGQPVPMDAVEASLLRALGTVFGRQVRRTGQRSPALGVDGV